MNEIRNLEVGPVEESSARLSTRIQSARIAFDRRKELLMKKLGNVKTFIFFCAEKHSWSETDYTLEKLNLRKKYDVSKKPVPDWIMDLPEDELLAMLLGVFRNQFM